MKTERGLAAILGEMQHVTPTQLTREQRVFLRFVEALHDFSYDPGPDNLERYLAASNALDESRRARPAPRGRRARNPIRLSKGDRR